MGATTSGFNWKEKLSLGMSPSSCTTAVIRSIRPRFRRPRSTVRASPASAPTSFPIWIQLEGEAFPGHVSIQLHHGGDSFDPSAVPPPAFDGSRESGFGTYIISRSVDEVRYYRDDLGRSCVALIKNQENAGGSHGSGD